MLHQQKWKSIAVSRAWSTLEKGRGHKLFFVKIRTAKFVNWSCHTATSCHLLESWCFISCHFFFVNSVKMLAITTTTSPWVLMLYFPSFLFCKFYENVGNNFGIKIRSTKIVSWSFLTTTACPLVLFIASKLGYFGNSCKNVCNNLGRFFWSRASLWGSVLLSNIGILLYPYECTSGCKC